MKLGLITHEMRKRFKECPRRLYWPIVAGIQHKEDFIEEEFQKAFRDGIKGMRMEVSLDDAASSKSTALGWTLQTFGTPPDVIAFNQRALKNCIERYAREFTIETEDVMFPEPFRLGDEVIDIHGIIPRHNGAIILIDRVVDRIQTLDTEAHVLDEEINHIASMLTLKALKHKERIVRPTHALVRQVTKRPGNHLEQKVPISMPMVENFWKLKQETNHVINAMSESVHELHDWPWNFGTCSKSTGQCQYLKLCSQNTSAKLDQFIHTSLEPLDNGKQRKQLPRIERNTFNDSSKG